jgi:hypothetical protein
VDAVEVFLGLLTLGFLVGVPTAAFVALARTGRLTTLSAEVTALRHRLEDLERRLAAHARMLKPGRARRPLPRDPLRE